MSDETIVPKIGMAKPVGEVAAELEYFAKMFEELAAEIRGRGQLPTGIITFIWYGFDGVRRKGKFGSTGFDVLRALGTLEVEKNNLVQMVGKVPHA